MRYNFTVQQAYDLSMRSDLPSDIRSEAIAIMASTQAWMHSPNNPLNQTTLLGNKSLTNPTE